MMIRTASQPTNMVEPCPHESYKTFLWWKLLCGISMCNISLWTWTFYQHHPADSKNIYQQWHLVLSGIYTIVCAYRSVLPRIDLERYCLFDTQLSSVVLGRSAATIAEIAFATQLALLLHEWGGHYHHPICQFLSYLLPPILTIAQVFCWMGVVSRNHVFHAIEESLWAISFLGIAAVMADFAYRGYKDIAAFATIGALMSLVYVAYMVMVDVPMYLERWRSNQQSGKFKPMSLHVGWWDAWGRRVVTQEWKVWKHEVAWLTGYFSVAVWTSIAMNHFPRTSA